MIKYKSSLNLAFTLLCFTGLAMAENNTTELSMEEQIKQALGEVKPITQMQFAEPKILSESEVRTLKNEKKELIKRQKAIRKKAERKKKLEEIDINAIPMAKTYSMDQDMSEISE
jgi:hypothetical protein